MSVLQAMIYCGVPAGMEAFRIAAEVLDGEEQRGEHWHGAAPGTLMVHLAVSLGPTQWLEPVSDEDYAHAFREQALADRQREPTG